MKTNQPTIMEALSDFAEFPTLAQYQNIEGTTKALSVYINLIGDILNNEKRLSSIGSFLRADKTNTTKKLVQTRDQLLFQLQQTMFS